jgi:hypothetical protein
MKTDHFTKPLCGGYNLKISLSVFRISTCQSNNQFDFLICEIFSAESLTRFVSKMSPEITFRMELVNESMCMLMSGMSGEKSLQYKDSKFSFKRQ